MTVSEAIKAAYRLAIRTSDPETQEMADGLEALNLMLQELETTSSGIYHKTRESFSLVQSTVSYTIGSGQDFDTTLPTEITSAYVRDGSYDYPVRVISDKKYGELTLKTTESRPYYLYYEKGASTGTILVYPVPEKAYTLHLHSNKPLGSYVTTTESLGLPREYEPYIKFNLAVELAIEFGAPISQGLVARAERTKKSLKDLHKSPIPTIRTSPLKPAGRAYDFFTDSYRE